MYFSQVVRQVIAVLVGAVALKIGMGFPVFGIIISMGLLAYAVLLWRYSSAWLVVLPAALPVLDLTPWSGRILVTEFDLLVYITAAVALWKGRFSFDFLKENRLIGYLLVALSLSFLLSTLMGLLRSDGGFTSSFYLFHDPVNSLRVSKGFWEALLFLPMLDYERRSGKAIGRLFSLGMIAGLLMCSVVIVWERLMFPGLFNFSSNYRASGMFSGMLLGGALLDDYLILAVPFFLSCFYFFRSRFFAVLGVLLFAGAIFSVLMTVSRSTFMALAVSLLILAVGGRKVGSHFTRKNSLLAVLSVVAAMIILPVLGGDFVRSRFSTTLEDFKHRVEHWSEAVEIMEGPLVWLVGEGKGTFPSAYRERTIDGQMMASFKLLSDENGPFLRLSPSDDRGDLFVRQRIPVNEAGEYNVKIRLRSHSERTEKLLVEFCERNILPLGNECRWKGFSVPGGKKGQWVEINRQINGTAYSKGVSLFKPLEISLLSRGLKAGIDVSKIEIYAPSGQQIIRNSEFAEGFDSWVFSSGHHLAWHVKNVWVSAFFEGGGVELLLISLYLFWLVIQCYRRSQNGDHFATMLLAAISGAIIVGLFGSFLDDPRVAWLLFIVSWFVLIPPKHCEEQGQRSRVPWKVIILTMGIVGGVGMVVGVVQLMFSHQITARQLMVEGEKRLGLDLSWLLEASKPAERYRDHPFDGRVRAGHPRIVLPEIEAWTGQGVSPFIEARIAGYRSAGEAFQPACNQAGLLPLTACWLAKGGEARLDKVRTQLLNAKLITPKARGQYSNGWELALAYDLTFNAFKNNQDDLSKIEGKIKTALKETLIMLDEGSASLWHGRTSHAAIAWLCAIVLQGDSEEVQQLRKRAQGHFLDAMSAVAFTEAWPEGYSYWIQDRALLVSLAASSYLNGLESSKSASNIKEIMRRVGYWHLYATRPDNRIEGYGDEGPRIDLKDETRRVVDVIAQMTQDPILAGYSKYLAQLHGREAYYRGHRWGFLLFNDPGIAAIGDGTLASLAPYLSESELFGKNAVNQAYLRSGWGKDDTFISFRAGHKFTHHGHYDAGHFTLFKDKPLAVNSSLYGGFFSGNRLNYSIRTLAKNSLLIINPDEKMATLKEADSYGGQRVVMPTGSAVTGLEDWHDNYKDGLHFEGGELRAYQEVPAQYVFISTDITAAYNSIDYDENGVGGKVSQVLRTLFYLTDEDQLIIYDRVTSTDSSYRKKWLLHSINRPEAKGLKILKGEMDNGILETASHEAIIKNGRGRLKVTRLLPESGTLRFVGGKDYQFFAENSEDKSVLSGINQSEGAVSNPWYDGGLWRVEIEPAIAALKDEFLVVLSPSLDSVNERFIQKLTILEGRATGVLTSKSAILFIKPVRQQRVVLTLEGSGQERLVITGIPFSSGDPIVKVKGSVLSAKKMAKGIWEIDIRGCGKCVVNINW